MQDVPDGTEETEAATVLGPRSPSGMDPTVKGAVVRLPTAGPAPDNVEGFRILRPIASGGMGTVYEAEQLNPKRRVALKVVKPGMATPDLMRRFEFEARALAQLDHPGIARIYQAGTFDSGAGPQPFFAMEFVDGLPLDKWVEARELKTRGRIELMARVCDAVEHAHQKGIIHRDLKPGNILVVDDGSPIGQPKVLDFGLARATDSDVQTVSLQTEAGQILGTVRYMSPEQTMGRPEAVDTRSDVYALGVIAFEILTGRHPQSIQGRMMLDALSLIRDEEAVSAGSIDRSLRGDVETILGKALEKEKSRRYSSASDLSDDLRRYLHDEPIAARPPSFAYQFSKFARRNKAVVAGAAGVFLSLVIGMSAALWQAARANEKADQANAAEARTATALEVAQRAQTAAEAAHGEARTHAELSWRQFYDAQMSRATFEFREGRLEDLRRSLESVIPAEGREDLREFQWRMLWREATAAPYRLVARKKTGGPRDAVATGYSPDGKLLVLAQGSFLTPHADGVLKFLDAATLEEKRSLVKLPGGIGFVAFAPDGRTLATGGSGERVHFLDVETGEVRWESEKLGDWIIQGKFSHDGKRFAALTSNSISRTRDAALHLFEVGKRSKPKEVVIGSDAHDFDYSPDDALIAVAATNREEFSSEGGRVRLIDARTGAIRSTAGFPNALYGLAWSAYGGELVTGDGMGTVSIFPRGDRLDEGSFKLVHTTLAFTMDFGNEGKVCVTGAGQPVHPLAPGEAIVWDPATWRQVARIEVPDNGIWSVSASPVSPALALGRFDGNLEIWDRADGRGVAETPRLPSAVVSLDASPEGRWLAASTGLYPKIAVFEDLTAPATDASQVFLLDESRTVHPLEGCAPGSSGAEVTFSPDGSSVAAVTSWLAENIMTHEAGQAEIALWGTEDRALRWTTSLDSPGGFSLAFDPTGETLFAADSNRLTSRDAKTGAVLRTAAIPVSIYGSSLVWSERAGGLLLGSIFAYRGLTTFVARDPLSAGVMVFDRELNRVASWDRFPGGTNVLSLSPDGASVAGGGYRELRFWRTEEGGAGVRGSGVEHTISALARTPDGKTLAAAGAKKFSETTTGAISFWNPETGVCRGTVDLPGFTVLSLAFSADGKRLHYGRSDGGIGTLDAADAS